jgi:hypothetical protein
MRARELLELYKQGSRDFRNQNLRGRSFAGQDLSGANLSGADIRGADFTQANLQNTNFTGVKAGILPEKKLLIFLASVVASLMLGGLAGWVDAFVELEFHNSDGFGGIAPSISSKWVVLLILLVFGFVAQRFGMLAGFSFFTVALLIVGVGAFVTTFFVSIAAAIVMAITIVVFIAAVTAVIVILSLTTALAVSMSAGAVVLAAFTPVFAWVAVPSAQESAVVLAIVVTLLSAYIGWCAYHGDERHRELRAIAEIFATRHGTNFRGADLTNADFSQARLKGSNFNEAIFNRTRITKAAYAGAAV